MDTEQTDQNIQRVLGGVLRRLPWILLCAAAVAVAAYGFSERESKKYTATAALVFDNDQQSQQIAGLQIVGTNNQIAQQNTNLKLVELGDMAEKTATLLKHGLTKKAISEALGIDAQGESNIVDVSATAHSPSLAAAIANTYTKQFVEEQANSDHAYYASALALVNKQLAALSSKARTSTAGIALQDRAQSLGVLAELRNGNVQIAQAASVPTSASSPKVSRNTIIGALLGLLLGLSLAFLLERFDRRIREPKDLEAIYGLPLLGVVPESAALSQSVKSGNEPGKPLSAGETEAFHLIRAHLRYFNVDRELHSLLVASAAPGDGKTTIARHLAAAAARMGSRVLLLESDLRRPTIAQQLGLMSGPGLADVLIGAVSLQEATQTLDLGGVGAADPRTLDVLVAGAAVPPNPGELIESHAMAALLARVKSTYDLVVIDTPPLTAVSDAFPLLRRVDGVLIVGRVGRNRRDVAERLHETLTGAGAPLLGVVANGLRKGRLGPYGYNYGYKRAGAPGSPRVADTAAEPSSNGAVPAQEPVGTGG